MENNEFKSFAKMTKDRVYNTWCRWNSTVSIDPYGKGCAHDCKYCYAKSLLDFRKLWNAKNPAVADVDKIRRYVAKNLHRGDIVRLGIMTDPFQPIESRKRATYCTIDALNKRRVEYLIVTKSALVAADEYLELYDPKLAHFQITITTTNDELAKTYEHASLPSQRIAAVEKLSRLGFDVAVRLSPFIPEYVDIERINAIQCDKILVEFLKVSPWIKKWFDIDYTPYSLKVGGYQHLQLEDKIKLAGQITGFKEHTVGEYVKEHDEWFRENWNTNKHDCCNLRTKEE